MKRTLALASTLLLLPTLGSVAHAEEEPAAYTFSLNSVTQLHLTENASSASNETPTHRAEHPEATGMPPITPNTTPRTPQTTPSAPPAPPASPSLLAQPELNTAPTPQSSDPTPPRTSTPADTSTTPDTTSSSAGSPPSSAPHANNPASAPLNTKDAQSAQTPNTPATQDDASTPPAPPTPTTAETPNPQPSDTTTTSPKSTTHPSEKLGTSNSQTTSEKHNANTTTPDPEAPSTTSTASAPQAPAPAPVSTTENDGHCLTTDDYSFITAPLQTDEFAVAGIHWQGIGPQQVDLRVLINHTWTQWYTLEIEQGENGVTATEPFMAAGATGIQIRTRGTLDPEHTTVALNTGAGSEGTTDHATITPAPILPAPHTELSAAENSSAVSELLSSPRPAYTFDSPNTPAPLGTHLATQHADSSASPSLSAQSHRSLASESLLTSPETTRPLAAQNTVRSPAIVTRTQWGGPAVSETWPANYVPLSGAVVHHTAGSNDYTPQQAPGIVKAIWNYHTNVLEWGDIGYNFLIDKYGTVYEGRTGSLNAPAGKMVIGGHAAPGNTGSVGVSVMGDYTLIDPSSIVLNRISDVIAWQFSRSHVNPYGLFTFTAYSGKRTSIPAINGHRDISPTACPGRIYNYLDQIRAQVAAKINATNTGGSAGTPASLHFDSAHFIGGGWPASGVWSMGDFTRNGYDDLILRTPTGALMLYEGVGRDLFNRPRQIGRGWGGMTQLFTGFDFDGDGYNDIIGLHSNNRLYLYRGTANNTVTDGRQIGHGWNFAYIFGVSAGIDGKPSFIGIKPDGTRHTYATNGAGMFTTSRVDSGNYRDLAGALGVGDWNDSGLSDAIVIEPSGRLFFYPDIARGSDPKTQIGRGFANYIQIARASSSGNEHRFYAISNTGQLYSYTYRYF
ncbi:N-acetylmuramoyl-L-alanine amidase [Trueperella sp. LYQ143]|uniref:N-acetylmuramoyl-L-alanine amidase n=1 Tax=Trueperella sp. LYQ143 TaxID=3391059 RepID=UPI0039837445